MELSRFLAPYSTVLRSARPAIFASAAGPKSLARRCLHCGRAAYATPVNHPNVPGPPPQPPQVSADQPDALTARKRKQAELLQKGQALKVNPSKPASALQKRFWKEVSVKSENDGLRVMLDSRPVRTASREVLTLPHSKRGLATAIALEWDNLVSAQQALKQHYIPLTSLISRAIDLQAADAQGNTKLRDEVIKMMMRHLSTDTLLCWAPEKNLHDPTGMSGPEQGNASTQTLREKQIAVAEPIIAHLKTHVFPGIEIEPILEEDSIVPKKQSQMTRQIISGWLHGLPPFELAALERAVLATKSLLVGIRLLVDWSKEFKHLQSEDRSANRFGVVQAAKASTIEVVWQTNMWGEVEDTHDVDKEDLARQLGSAVLLVS